MLTRRHQRGLSLIETLVGLIIGAIVVMAILGLFSTTITGSHYLLYKGKLDKELNAAMDMIVSDVQRAGYWSNATLDQTNPYMAAGFDITVNLAGNCFTFTYDVNNSNTTGAAPTSAEEFGFGLDTSTNSIKARPQLASADFSCDTKNGWVDITDPSTITITAFSAALSTVAIPSQTGATNTTNYRTLTLTMTGHLTSDVTLSETITRTIKLYNNSYTP